MYKSTWGQEQIINPMWSKPRKEYIIVSRPGKTQQTRCLSALRTYLEKQTATRAADTKCFIESVICHTFLLVGSHGRYPSFVMSDVAGFGSVPDMQIHLGCLTQWHWVVHTPCVMVRVLNDRCRTRRRVRTLSVLLELESTEGKSIGSAERHWEVL